MVDHGRRQKVIGNTQIDRQRSGGCRMVKSLSVLNILNNNNKHFYYKYGTTTLEGKKTFVAHEPERSERSIKITHTTC